MNTLVHSRRIISKNFVTQYTEKYALSSLQGNKFKKKKKSHYSSSLVIENSGHYKVTLQRPPAKFPEYYDPFWQGRVAVSAFYQK